MVRPTFVVALVATIAAAGVSLAFTAASRARVLRSGAVSVHTRAAPPSARPQVRLPAASSHPNGGSRRHAGATPTAVLRVRDGARVRLLDRPGGRVIATLRDRTEFGSPTALSVVSRRGSWVGVPSAALRNGQLGWVDTRDTSLARRATHARLVVRLSRRRVELRVRGRVARRAAVAIGRPGTPTPTGRFAVTDKMAGARFGPYYGCCILALSGHQPSMPAGWKGGDRLAIHGTNAASSIGTPASAGCLRAADADLRVLMKRVPLGAPVIIRD